MKTLMMQANGLALNWTLAAMTNDTIPGIEDSAEFDREYWAIRSGSSEQTKAAPKTSWGALIKSYRAG
jgi:hypothetical protein